MTIERKSPRRTYIIFIETEPDKFERVGEVQRARNRPHARSLAVKRLRRQGKLPARGEIHLCPKNQFARERFSLREHVSFA